jgi:CheY-like chemotaxis protein
LHASAAEAIDLIAKVNPLLAFLDVRMPGMNGLECTRRLKVLVPQLKIKKGSKRGQEKGKRGQKGVRDDY